MKRFLGFVVLALFFTSCDDGDMQEVSFEFDESSASSCNENIGSDKFFIYKTTDRRALIMELKESNFTTTVTSDSLGAERIKLNIGTDNKLTYRVYNDDITTATICSTFPPSYPVVEEERNAAGGTMFLNTTMIKSEPDSNGATKITDYLHTITFSDITFNFADGSQRYESLPPVTYLKRAPSFTAFDNSNTINRCSGDLRFLFKNDNTQSLALRLSEADVAFLFSNEINTTKTRLLNTENTLTHQFFSKTETTPVTEAYLCATTPPAFPILRDTWRAADGVEGVSGIIEVVTSETLDGYKHVITLRGVKMTKGSQNFLLKNNYVFGEFEVVNP